MKVRALLILLASVCCASIRSEAQVQAYYRAITAAVSGDSINRNLKNFEDLGIKEENTAAIENTRLWLAEKYKSYAYSEVYFDTFIYASDTLYNVIADKKGSIDSNTWVIVCGHYDTEGGPGVNDNGSGVASILEIARLLQSIPTYYSVRFINFAGEEDGYKGSINYVTKKVVPSNMQVRIVFNLDEIGGIAGITNSTITCERDEGGQSSNNAASFHFTNILDTMMRRYGELFTQQSAAFLSDYIPFELNGYTITGLYETNVTPFRHTINDSMKNLDTQYVRKVCKGALAATMKFAGVIDQGEDIQDLAEETFTLYPNPCDDQLFFQAKSKLPAILSIHDMQGKLIKQGSLNSSEPLSTVSFSPGLYFYRITDLSGMSIQTGSFLKR